MAGAGEEPNGFKQFDVVSDHHFNVVSKSDGEVCFGNKVHHKIMREWKILEKHLPDSIYVRIYETHIDLLRAIIIDTTGTPYHDVLFLFDIAFPSNYPTRLPQHAQHLAQQEVGSVSVNNHPGPGVDLGSRAQRAALFQRTRHGHGPRRPHSLGKGGAGVRRGQNKKKVTSKKKVGISSKRHAEVAASVD
ncbi:hypothetical protein C1H46_011201 [Malus baccata]|uniref:UBC core domain-containing protein n=1 Tax=Malus baccata TaxID=106549 RepID=A0A540MWP7_MALBA|nr:hypothetical protein C1H46_011201 [Malus baccata]